MGAGFAGNIPLRRIWLFGESQYVTLCRPSLHQAKVDPFGNPFYPVLWIIEYYDVISV